MGTPQFSCPTLEKLLTDPFFEIAAIYTREPQIAGRGHKIQNSPIHELALKNNLKIFTPKTLRDAKIQEEFIVLKADACVVVAYGLLLPKEILQGTRLGCFNIHPSLLPKWRGAAPIQRTIMSGDKETAVDIIKMDEGLDSGDVVFEQKISLKGNETYASLAPELAQLGAKMMLKVLRDAADGKIVAKQQNHALATYAKKIEKAECAIDWTKSAAEIEQKIRALNGVVAANFNYDNEKIKIFAAEILDKNSSKNEAGKILANDFSIQCKSGVLRPLKLQRQGKNVVSREEFLRGFKLEVGKILTV